MRFLRFICWMRGYHKCPYALTFFDPAEKGGGNCWGTTMPCLTCGKIYPSAGTFSRSSMMVLIDFNAEVKPI